MYFYLQLTNALYIKVFPDIAVFYGAIYLVVVIALVADKVDFVRNRLVSRPPFLFGLCVGEALLTITLATLLGGLFCYWYFDHGWEEEAVSTRSSLERAARSIGQLCNLVTGLLILPVTRNSVWSLVFGVGWESMIIYHVWMGYLLMALVCSHMVCWWGVYSEQGTFPHDIFAVPQTFHAVCAM